MRDVARLAGVSPQTVSRVLNAQPHVTASTRLRVLDAVAQLRYRRNSSARALSTRRTMTFGVLSVGLSQWGPSVVLLEVVRAAREAGYATSVINLGVTINRSTIRAALEDLAADGVDGIIAIAPIYEAMLVAEGTSVAVPLVVVRPGDVRRAGVVAVDEVLGARAATRHLLELGHETVWHVSGPDGWIDAQARLRGWRAELNAAGLGIQGLIVGDWSSRSGYNAGRALAKMTSLTAVFVANDQMALGVLRALQEAGRTVPDDISVVGFDDQPEAAFFQPSLTTMRLNFEEVARRCVAHLLSMVGKHSLNPKPAVTPELIVRATTAPPRSAAPNMLVCKPVAPGSDRTATH